MPFTTNASQLAQKYMRRAHAVFPEQRREASTIARGVGRESKAQLRRHVYAVPIPRSPSGRALWIRTRRLINTERARVVELAGVRLENPMPYARQRHEQRHFRYMHAAPWRTETLRSKRRWVLERRHEALQRALRGR